ncbi:hypothetical protein FCV25MIE_14285 [Fagus crenata]
MSEQNRIYGSEKENVRSLEDEDFVRRSTKKKKDSHPTRGHEDGTGTGFCSAEGFPAGMSYRDSLLGELPGAYEQAFFGSAMDDDVVSSDEESDAPEDGEAVIHIPRETKLRIRAAWRTSFIVKVFGRLDKCPERSGASTTPTAPAPPSSAAPSVSAEVPNSFGPWMLVTRRKRQTKPSTATFVHRDGINSVASLSVGSGAHKNKEAGPSHSTKDTVKAPPFNSNTRASPNTRAGPNGKDLSDHRWAPLSGLDFNETGLTKPSSLKPTPSSIQSQPTENQIIPSHVLAPHLISNPSSSPSLRPQKPVTTDNNELHCDSDSPIIPSKMCSGILNDHHELPDERNKLPILPPQPDGSGQCNMGDVARNSLECYGRDRELSPNH